MWNKSVDESSTVWLGWCHLSLPLYAFVAKHHKSCWELELWHEKTPCGEELNQSRSAVWCNTLKTSSFLIKPLVLFGQLIEFPPGPDNFHQSCNKIPILVGFNPLTHSSHQPKCRVTAAPCPGPSVCRRTSPRVHCFEALIAMFQSTTSLLGPNLGAPRNFHTLQNL